MNFDKNLFEGKVCIVTGGSRGGMLKEIAKEYLRHGAKAIVLMSRNKEKNEAVCKDLSQYGTAVSIPGDVSKIEDCKRVCEETKERFGSIDVLVNGAAGNFLASTEKLSANGMRKVLEIDTLGTFNMSKCAFVTAMKSQRKGVIINISATLHWNGSWGQVHSSAAKAGVDAITKVLACEWGPYGIRVCGIIPGPIRGTEGFERLGDINNINNKERTNQAMQAKSTQKGAEDLKTIMPLQRFGEVEDISNAALFLGSPAAAYVTGTNLLVDGGQALTAPNFLFAYPPFVKMWSKGKL